MSVLRDILVSFGVEVSRKEKITDVDGEVVKTIDHVKQLATAFAGLNIGKAVAGFITGTVEMGAKVVDTSNRLGIATDDLQAFQFAAKMVGADTEGAAKSLQFLERHVGLASEGNKAAAKDFAALGVSVRDSTGHVKPLMDLLPDVADGFAKLKSDPERAAYAVKFFSRQGYNLLPLLRDGKNGLRDLYKQFELLGGGLKKDFLESAKEADRAMTRLGVGFDIMKSRIVLGIIPGLEKGMEYLSRFFNFMSQLGDRTYVAQTALLALAGVLAVAFAPLLIELLPIIALFGGLYLIFDDLYTLFEGGHSLIGDLIDKLFGLGASKKFVAEVKDEFGHLVDRFHEALPTIEQVGNFLAKAFEKSKPVLEALVRTLGAFLRLLAGAGEAALDGAHGDWKALLKDIDRAGDAVFSGKDSILGKYFKQGGTGPDTFSPSNQLSDYGFATAKPVSPAELALPSGFVGPSSSTFQPSGPISFDMRNETHIMVQGATTNEETGRAVAAAAKDASDSSHREAKAALQALGAGRTK